MRKMISALAALESGDQTSLVSNKGEPLNKRQSCYKHSLWIMRVSTCGCVQLGAHSRCAELEKS